MKEVNVQDKIRGSLFGGAIGDALGYQIEFETCLKSPVAKYQNDQGIISDDTQMTLFTANALLWRETRWHLRGIAVTPPEAVYCGYLDWLGTQQRTDYEPICWIKNIPELQVVREPGMTCIEALSKGEPGTFAEPINDSKGSGGIMRLAPFGLFTAPDERIGDFAARACALTHGHPLAIVSAYVFSFIVYYVSLCDFSIEKSVNLALENLAYWQPEVYKNNRKLRIDWSAEKSELKTLLQKAITLAKSDEDDQVAISRLGLGWTAEEALAIAVYSSLKYQQDFQKAIISATNHAGDSDTTGAICGNIIGGKLGHSKIPPYYIDHLELKDTILELADDLTSGVPVDKNGEVSDEAWLKKYLYIS